MTPIDSDDYLGLKFYFFFFRTPNRTNNNKGRRNIKYFTDAAKKYWMFRLTATEFNFKGNQIANLNP